MVEESRRWILLKYFLHGIAFSAILIVLILFWSVLLVVLVTFGYVIGLILGLIALFYLLGGVNTYLTGVIWGIRVKRGWKTLLRHGLVLFMGLVLVHIPALIVARAVPSPVATVPLLIIYGFVDGFVALHIGAFYKEEPEEADARVSDES